VLLGIRDDRQFPLIFYRENCADMALCEDDIDPPSSPGPRVVATGTHLSHPRTEAAVLKALRWRASTARRRRSTSTTARTSGASRATARARSRFIESAKVTAKLQATCPLRPDRRHRGGVPHRRRHHRHHRGPARGAGRLARDARLQARPDGRRRLHRRDPRHARRGRAGPGFPIEVFNVLGAGDGFMSGLLKGWLDGEPWPVALTYANACGAFAVSRHGCTPAYPSWEELRSSSTAA
jgi:5-dehydro-2-deoxygluconokinase